MNTPENLTLAMGCDQAGFELKGTLVQLLTYQFRIKVVLDCGTNSTSSVDYPVFAKRVAQAVASCQADLGFLVCGTDIGISIAANKIPGIIAANCRDSEDARLARAHNAANILVLGGLKNLAVVTVQEIIGIFLSTKFEGGRHIERVRQTLFADI